MIPTDQMPPVKTPQARWIDTAEAAKMLRPQLKKAFPSVKFSVRISRYAGGSAIDVRWTDGPTDDQVSAVCAGFRGNRFDGMDDLEYGADSWHCVKHGARAARTYGTGDDRSGPAQSRCCDQAELVHFGSSYVSTSRALSAEFRAELENQVAKEAGESYNGDAWITDWRCSMSQRAHQIGWKQAR